MRLQDFIDDNVASPKQWESLKADLERDCMPYIKQLRGTNALLLRGAKATINTWEKVSQRTDRKPRFINKELHEMMDDWTKKNWGFKARSESTFTTKHRKNAGGYGMVRVMFPIGKFDYAWNNDVYDLYNNYDGFEYRMSREYGSRVGKPDATEEELIDLAFRDNIEPHLKKYKVNTGLSTYLKNEDGYSECIVHCKEYYLINYGNWFHTLKAWYSKRYWEKK